jgi:hypothetical protein
MFSCPKPVSVLEDYSSSFQAGSEWELIDWSASSTLEKIKAINCGCFDPYEYITWISDWIGDLSHLEDIWFAILCELYSFHGYYNLPKICVALLI